MSAEQPSQRLVERAVEGDPVALKLLLTESYAELGRYVASKIPSALARTVDPEDIVQQTHIEVFRSIGRFMPSDGDSFQRWTRVIALNRVRDAAKRFRAQKRGGGRTGIVASTAQVEDSTIALLSMLVSPEKTPSRCVARVEAVAAVDAALEELPERTRTAVRLVYIEGRSVRDAAGELGCTDRAIHGLCRRGLSLLECRLQSASRFLSSCG